MALTEPIFISHTPYEYLIKVLSPHYLSPSYTTVSVAQKSSFFAYYSLLLKGKATAYTAGLETIKI